MNDRNMPSYSKLNNEDDNFEIEQPDHQTTTPTIGYPEKEIKNIKFIVDQQNDKLFCDFKHELNNSLPMYDVPKVIEQAKHSFSIYKKIVKEKSNNYLYIQYLLLDLECQRKVAKHARKENIYNTYKYKTIRLYTLGNNYKENVLQMNIAQNMSPLGFAILGQRYKLDNLVSKKPKQQNEANKRSQICFFMAYLLTENKQGVFASEMLFQLKDVSININGIVAKCVNTQMRPLYMRYTLVSHSDPIFFATMSELCLSEAQNAYINNKLTEIVRNIVADKPAIKEETGQKPNEELVLSRQLSKPVQENEIQDTPTPTLNLQEFNNNNNLTQNDHLLFSDSSRSSSSTSVTSKTSTSSSGLSEVEQEIETLSTEVTHWQEQASLWSEQMKIIETQAVLARNNFENCQDHIKALSQKITAKHAFIHSVKQKKFGG